MSTTEKKDFKPSAAPLWFKGDGKFMLSMDLGPEEVARIQEQVEAGGRVKIRFLEEKSRLKDSSPHAYLEFISAEDNTNYKESRTRS